MGQERCGDVVGASDRDHKALALTPIPTQRDGPVEPDPAPDLESRLGLLIGSSQTSFTSAIGLTRLYPVDPLRPDMDFQLVRSGDRVIPGL